MRSVCEICDTQLQKMINYHGHNMHTRYRYFLLTEIKVIADLFVIVQDLLIYVGPI